MKNTVYFSYTTETVVLERACHAAHALLAQQGDLDLARDYMHQFQNMVASILYPKLVQHKEFEALQTALVDLLSPKYLKKLSGVLDRYQKDKSLTDYLFGVLYRDLDIGVYRQNHPKTTALDCIPLPETETGQELSLDPEREWRFDPAEVYQSIQDQQEAQNQLHHLQQQAALWSIQDSNNTTEQQARHCVYAGVLELISQQDTIITPKRQQLNLKGHIAALCQRAKRSERSVRNYVRDFEQRLFALQGRYQAA